MTDDTMPAAPALPLSEVDALRIELSALRAEVETLRAIRDAAQYVHGPAGCTDPDGDRDCPEYRDANGDDRPEVELCSHVQTRYARYADVHARQRLEWLVDEIRLIVDDPDADHREAVREAVHSGVYSLVTSLQQEVDEGDRDRVDDREPYRSVLAETIGAWLEAVVRAPDA